MKVQQRSEMYSWKVATNNPIVVYLTGIVFAIGGGSSVKVILW